MLFRSFAPLIPPGGFDLPSQLDREPVEVRQARKEHKLWVSQTPLNPEDLLLVIHEGDIRLFDPSLLEPITEHALTAENFQPITPDGKYVAGDLPGLMQEIRRYCPEVTFPVLP